MLEQALTALAAAGGTAVVQAAGTDAWGEFRLAVARWFGRGDERREQAELERLEQTRHALATTEAPEAEQVLVVQETAWRTRMESLLENLDATEQAQAAEDLRAVLAQHGPGGTVSAGEGGLAVGGDVHIRAEGGSVAAGILHGGAHVGPPTVPDPSQG